MTDDADGAEKFEAPLEQPEREDPDAQRFRDLLWAKFEQRLDVDDELAALHDKRLADEKSFRSVVGEPPIPPAPAVAWPDTSPEARAERLSSTGSRFLVNTTTGDTIRWTGR